MKKIFLSIAFSVTFSVVLVEIGCFLVVKLDYLSANIPDYSYELIQEPFWADINPYFGVWHNRKEYRHVKDCFDIVYRTNSAGAIDTERSLLSKKPRVVVLGDSFVEGYGAQTQKRFTDLLEKSTGIEFLNFGTAGNFSPTQYYLMYKHLAKKYSHEVVIIALLPANDFIEDDFENSTSLFAGRYRPYWVGEYPSYRLTYSLETLDQSTWSVPYFEKKNRSKKVKFTEALRSFTYTYNVYEYFRSLMTYRKSLKVSYNEPLETNLTSGYYDYSPIQWSRMKFSLQKIEEEAADKRLVILTIPTLNDIRRFSQNRLSPLHALMEKYCNERNIKYVDLLPFFFENYSPWEDLYLPCDGHWSEKGHKAAAEILIQNNVFNKSDHE